MIFLPGGKDSVSLTEADGFQNITKIGQYWLEEIYFFIAELVKQHT